MTDNTTCLLEWNGEEYELKYTFKIIRRLRSEGINVPKIFRECMSDKNAAADYGDEISEMIAFLLKDAGCKNVTGEDVWRSSLSNPDLQSQCFGLLIWIGANHFASSKAGAVPGKKPTAPRKKKKRKST